MKYEDPAVVRDEFGLPSCVDGEQPTQSKITRRGFLQVATVAGVGLVVGCYLPGKSSEATEHREAAFEPNAWVEVGTDGIVTVTISKPDMGQGPRTTLAMIVAEEIGVDWRSVRVRQGQADQAKYGGQTVGGSSTVRGMYQPMRMAGATARTLLLTAAAQKWKLQPTDCRIENGVITGGDKRATLGELAADAAKLPAPESGSVKLKDPKDFTIIGKATPRIDNKDVVTGKAMYGLDNPIKAKVAVIARPPAFGGKASKWDTDAAMKVPGVKKILEVPRGIVVVADDTWAAIRGRQELAVAWDAGPNADLNSAKISEALRAQFGEHLATPAGAKVIDAVYELPYLSHATLEPQNCTIEVKGDKAVVWVSTQTPDGVREAVARELGIPSSNVEVNVTLVGGGFGRRLQADYAAEAASVAKAFGGSVRLMWTRDDDMQHDYYRPASMHSCRAGIDAAGKPVLWSHQYVQAGGRGGRSEFRDADIPYAIESSGMARASAPSPVPTGAWRSVQNTATGFVNESLIDELAHLAGKDPVAYRLANMSDDRLKNVLQVAADRSGWGKPLPAGHARGVGCFGGYGSYVAQVVELSVESGEVKLHNVWAVVDCGLAINPLGVIAQMQGGTVDGLSAALRAAITIDEGAVVQTNFSNFKWLRMHEVPPIDVHIVPSNAGPGGMGEPPVPAVTAAVANAIFGATGKRLRRLPIKRSDFA